MLHICCRTVSPSRRVGTAGLAARPDTARRRSECIPEFSSRLSPLLTSVLDEFMQKGIDRIGDVNLSPGAESQIMRLSEFAKSFSGLAGCPDSFAVRVQLEQLSG